MSVHPRPLVAHYRHAWLTPSETFVNEVVRRHRTYDAAVVTHALVAMDAVGVPGEVRVAPDGPIAAWLGPSAALRIRAHSRGLARALRAAAPDIVHAHFGEEAVVAAMALPAHVPLVATFYGFDATQLGRHALWRRRFGRLFRRASFVLAEGPHMRDTLLALGCPPDRARIQRIPIRLERFPFAPAAPPADGRFVLLQAARFVEKKGVDLTIQAFAAVADEWPAAELWLVGDGPERGRLEALAAGAGIGARVRFLGMLDHAEHARAMRRAHVFVQPSRTARNGDGEGGAPTTLLEAQAVGLQVVASDHADIPFVVAQGGGSIVPQDDLAALSDALRRTLRETEQWPDCARAGRVQVEREHDPRRLTDALERLYDEARGVPAHEAAARPAPSARPPVAGTAPLVSVVLPTHNRAGLLPRALDSVLAQTMPDFELIVVDDASTDDTGAVLESAAARDARIRPVALDAPGGAAAARNRGIAGARGRYVAFLDDDDAWLPRKLEWQAARMESAPDDVVACYGPYIYVAPDGRGTVLGTLDVSDAPPRPHLLRRSFVGNSTVLARRDVLAREPWDERLPRLQDLDLWLRLAAHGRFVFEPRPLARIFETAGNISSRPDALVAGAYRLVEKQRQAGATPREVAELTYFLGHELLAYGAWPEGRALLMRSVRARPWPPRRLVMLAVAAAGDGPYRAAVRVHRAVVGVG